MNYSCNYSNADLGDAREKPTARSRQIFVEVKRNMQDIKGTINNVIEGCKVLFDSSFSAAKASVKQALACGGIDISSVEGL